MAKQDKPKETKPVINTGTVRITLEDTTPTIKSKNNK